MLNTSILLSALQELGGSVVDTFIEGDSVHRAIQFADGWLMLGGQLHQDEGAHQQIYCYVYQKVADIPEDAARSIDFAEWLNSENCTRTNSLYYNHLTGKVYAVLDMTFETAEEAHKIKTAKQFFFGQLREERSMLELREAVLQAMPEKMSRVLRKSSSSHDCCSWVIGDEQDFIGVILRYDALSLAHLAFQRHVPAAFFYHHVAAANRHLWRYPATYDLDLKLGDAEKMCEDTAATRECRISNCFEFNNQIFRFNNLRMIIPPNATDSDCVVEYRIPLWLPLTTSFMWMKFQSMNVAFGRQLGAPNLDLSPTEKKRAAWGVLKMLGNLARSITR